MEKQNKEKTQEEDEEKVIDLKKSIERFGQLYPIIESQFGIVDGFHRKLAGGTEVKKIKVKDRLEHAVLRFHANQRDKSRIDHFNDNVKCFKDAATVLQIHDPSLQGTALVEKLQEVFGVSKKTVYKYLPDDFKRWSWKREEEKPKIPEIKIEEPAGKESVPVEEKKETKEKKEKKAKFSNERMKTRRALARHYPEHNVLLKQILRDVKPYLRTKDDINKFWHAAVNPGRFFKGEDMPKDPFTTFVRLFYLYDGPYMGWRPELPWWIKLRLEAIAEKKYPNLDANGLLVKIIGDWTCGATIEKVDEVTNEETIKRAKIELLKEWLIPKEKWHIYLGEEVEEEEKALPEEVLLENTEEDLTRLVDEEAEEIPVE